MVKWNYIRYCPFCEQDKPYPSKNSKNSKARCPDCLDDYFISITNRFRCKKCCKTKNKFKTNDLNELLNHFLTCGGKKIGD